MLLLQSANRIKAWEDMSATAMVFDGHRMDGESPTEAVERLVPAAGAVASGGGKAGLAVKYVRHAGHSGRRRDAGKRAGLGRMTEMQRLGHRIDDANRQRLQRGEGGLFIGCLDPSAPPVFCSAIRPRGNHPEHRNLVICSTDRCR